ncbi:hypothetical protein H5410_057397 [Solanum commersonii]|uniref:Uncharacterized protein n=1 Tax=Solanum commersonii TaxID=4109 RepID=A0A9J5WPY3_SOLCO|nr:hypothetical protein H5410_057397 [Solanum commersonii]
MSMEEMLKKIMINQAQLTTDMRNNQTFHDTLASWRRSRYLDLMRTKIYNNLCPPRIAPQVTMSSPQRPDKAVATSSQRKHGLTKRFGVKVVTKKGKAWWKKHNEASYLSDICIDKDSLAWELQQILRRIKELHMEFIFVKLGE